MVVVVCFGKTHFVTGCIHSWDKSTLVGLCWDWVGSDSRSLWRQPRTLSTSNSWQPESELRKVFWCLMMCSGAVEGLWGRWCHQRWLDPSLRSTPTPLVTSSSSNKQSLQLIWQNMTSVHLFTTSTLQSSSANQTSEYKSHYRTNQTPVNPERLLACLSTAECCCQYLLNS